MMTVLRPGLGDRGAEPLNVPGIDLTLASDVDGMRGVVEHLRDQGPVGACRHGGGRNDGHGSEGGGRCGSGHVRAQVLNGPIPDDLKQATLVVDKKKDGVIGVDETVVSVAHGYWFLFPTRRPQQRVGRFPTQGTTSEYPALVPIRIDRAR